jgi:hypothetical protein
MSALNKLYDFVKNAFNAALDLSLEKVIIISQMNQAFKNQFLTGEASRLVHASITIGDANYRHAMSNTFIRSGFMLTIKNDDNLKKSEAHEIAQYILENDFFVKQLMTLGFDTLIVKGKSIHSIKFKLSDYASLEHFFLGRTI